MKLSEFGEIIMGMSPTGETYNENGEGLPLLNGPTEFTTTSPNPKLYTTDSKRECKYGDLIFCVRGSTTGKMNWADQTYSIGRGVCAIRGYNDTDTKYIRYAIEDRLNNLLAIAGGGTFPNLKKDDIGNFLIPISQNRVSIVKILSAYDDLIENNNKRIKILEEMAQNIYKEWFVNFRFPNYENTAFDKETGLPVGWGEIKVKNYTSTISKGPSLNYETEGVKFPVLNQSCVRNGEIELEKVLYALELNGNKKHCYLQINDILINSMGQGTLGRVSKNVSINEKFIIHNCITFLRAKTIYSQYYLFYFIYSKQNYLEGLGQGSTGQTTLKTSLIEDMEIVLPNTDILNNFDNVIAPFWKQVGIFKNQNNKLKEARDILLPRLMNRTIEV